MVTETSILVELVMLVDRIPMPPSSRRRGRPKTYSDRLFLKVLVIMIVSHLPKVHSLLSVLEESEMRPLRAMFMRMAATRLAAPSSAGSRPRPRACRPRSAVSVDTCSP